MSQCITPLAAQTGFGFAAYLILITLLDELTEREVMTRDQLKDVLDRALLNAETHQTGAPSSEMVVVARKAIEGVLKVSEMKRTQRPARPPKR